MVGDVDRADGSRLASLIETDVVPVMAPLIHDAKGNMLNTNADTIAGETAKALSPFFNVTLVFCFEKPGVLSDENDDNSVIPLMTPDMFRQLTESGVVCGGMIPKLTNAFEALRSGVGEVIITSADSLSDLSKGTHVRL